MTTTHDCRGVGFRIVSGLLAGWLACLGGFLGAAEEPPTESGPEFFRQKVQPLLAQHCYRCHGEEEQESELRLDTWEGIRTGGVSGPAVVPGEPGQSLLLTAIRYVEDDLQMPPDRKLADEQIAVFREWIERGAPHPDEGKSSATESKRSAYRPLEEARRFWSFQPLRLPPVPDVRQRDWPENELDQFVLARLEAEGLRPAPAASRRLWLRRVTLDLTGLPPTPEAIRDFLADPSDQAWARVVDRLLASPAYGERWGRHWLDVARYADSNGLDENIAHGNAWRYRDYVIAAFNKDKPYDQFVREQLAGDQLPAVDDAQRREHLTATGFLSLGPKVLAEVDETKMEMDIIDEQIDTLGRSFMGLTLGCARCHDHKFDPISMRDYYALAGIFKSTRTMEHYRKIARWWENPVATPQQQQQLARHEQQVAEKQQAIKQLVESANQALLEASEPGAKLPKDPESQYPQEVRGQLQQLRAEVKRLQEQAPSLPTAMGVNDREVCDAAIHVRGSHLTLGPVVPRGVPEVLAGGDGLTLPEDASGRRELSDWLTGDSHPLTSRVIVNRVWRWHFGEGLARSTDNFGQLGTRPTHPQLLDWLATRLRRDGWSLKRLHRLIVLSSTYRMSSQFDAEAAGKDPDNQLLWRFPVRRLEAEAIRDSLLFVSERLDNRMGGSQLHVGNREFLFNHTSQDGTSYDSRQRSVYLPVVRNHLYEVFQLFDYADASVANGNRNSTTIAPQALFVMNSDLVWDAAVGLAQRLLEREADSDDLRVGRAYEIVYGRDPSEVERQRFLEHLDELAIQTAQLPTRPEAVATEVAEDSAPATEAPATESPATEVPATEVPATEAPATEAPATEVAATEAAPSQRATDSEARRRAWEMMCHVLLAGNEFIYVR